MAMQLNTASKVKLLKVRMLLWQYVTSSERLNARAECGTYKKLRGYCIAELKSANLGDVKTEYTLCLGIAWVKHGKLDRAYIHLEVQVK